MVVVQVLEGRAKICMCVNCVLGLYGLAHFV